MRATLVVCLLLAAPVAEAAPNCRLTGRPWLEGRRAGTEKIARAIDAKLGEAIDVFVAAPGKLDGRAVVFGESGAAGRVSWRGAGCGAIAVAWRRVEPRMQHEKTPAPNPDAKVYANAHIFGAHHGAWIGFDKLEYFETPLDGAAALTLTVRDAAPSEATGLQRDAAQKPLGAMRLCATVTAGGISVSTPGADDAPEGLIADRVFRYTFRSGDGFLGWLTSFYNVPYLFGSAGSGTRNQAERYLGADCADILVAALRRAAPPKRRAIEYSSVAELVGKLTRVAGPSEITPCDAGDGGCNSAAQPALRFGRDVQPGDLLALDYVGVDELPRSWDHIVAVVEDRGPDGKPDGVLGPDDLVADSGDSLGLKLARLGDQGHVRVEVLRATGVPVM